MILVAGLAIAGLAGIAAAFYFSVRPGNSTSRGRTAGSGRTETDRIDRIDRMDRSPAPGRTLAPSSLSRGGPAAGRSRPDPDDDFEGPPRRHAGVGHLAAGHRVHHDGSAGRTAPVGVRSAGAGTRPRPAERPDHDDDETADAIRSSRGRRRVGFRKGAEVDEELWPTETFGGVSDEQFWDDMASDKPLATTARSAASADPGSRRRLPDVAPLPNGRDADDRGRLDASRMAGGGSGAYPLPVGRPGPADRTASQPIQTSPQRIQTGSQSLPHRPSADPDRCPADPAGHPAGARGHTVVPAGRAAAAVSGFGAVLPASDPARPRHGPGDSRDADRSARARAPR